MANIFQRPTIPYNPDVVLPNSNRFELITQNKKAPTSKDFDGDINYLIYACNYLYDQLQGIIAGRIPGSDDPNSQYKIFATNGQAEPTLFWTHITEQYFADSSIPNRAFQAGSVTVEILGEGCVNSEKILPQNILPSHIKDLSIDSSKISPGGIEFLSIDTEASDYFIALFNNQDNNRLEGSKTKDNSMDASKLIDESILEPKYGDESVSRRALSAIQRIPVGCMQFWATIHAPDGWVFASGQAISRAKYSALFALWGVSFGAGDGSTTFNVPDTRGRVLVGIDPAQIGSPNSTANRVTNTPNSPYTIGGNGGEELHALTANENGPHVHNYGNPTSYGLLQGSGDNNVPRAFNAAGNTDSSGLGTPHNNMQPYALFPMIIYTGVL